MIIRAVCQMLAMFKANSLDWELDAAKALTQVSETEITFELNQGQMFQGGYGEMTADDVKVSQERYITPPPMAACCMSFPSRWRGRFRRWRWAWRGASPWAVWRQPAPGRWPTGCWG